MKITLQETINQIGKPNYSNMELAKKRWDCIAKPLNSMGKLESIIIKAAGLSEDGTVNFTKKCVVVMCADNGVVKEGVTQVSSEITAIVANNMTSGKATINVLSNKCGADVHVVDIGIETDIENPLIINRKIMKGTANFAQKPAMTRADAIKAIEAGIELVLSLKEKGYNLIATGEMGIGNTTTSSAITASLLGKPAVFVTGRGAGLSDKSLARKIEVIDDAIALHKPDPNDPIDVLSKVGGLDIAGMAGIFLGGALTCTPILVDGFISSVAALIAIRICPDAKKAIFATHISFEPAGKLLLDELSLPVMLDLHMCLGEGTGAVMAFPIFDLACEVYHKMASFEEVSIENYVPQGDK